MKTLINFLQEGLKITSKSRVNKHSSEISEKIIKNWGLDYFKFDKKAIYTHTIIINRLSDDDIFYAAHTSRRWNESLIKHIKNKEIEQICILVFKDNAI